MTESDDPIVDNPIGGFFGDVLNLNSKADPPDIQPGREIFTDPDILEPQRKKKKQRAARTVLTDDFAPPMLGKTGVLGLESQVA